MKNSYFILAAMAVLLILGAGVWYFSGQQNGPTLEQRLAACGSLPNGSTQTVTETSRMFVNIPKDLYPDVNLQVVAHGATAGFVSNGGPYGSAIGSQGKPDCWSYYFEFDRAGTVDLTSKSGVPGVPDYSLHVVVTSATNTPAAGVGAGAHCGGFIQNAPTCAPGLHCQLEASRPDIGGICVANEAAGGSGVRGVAMLGPTCPVMRNPPDPQCADKPYQGNLVLTTSVIRTPFSGHFGNPLPRSTS